MNITLMVGAGIFATIPTMLGLLPGPYAILAWAAAGLLIIVDGCVWAELGAAMPQSGGSYHFLLESYGRERWGKAMAFLFIWQFTVSGPLELGSGLAAIALFARDLTPEIATFDRAHSFTCVLSAEQQIAIVVGPARLFAFGLGLVIIALLYRRITSLGKWTMLFGFGLLVAVGWILAEGALRFRWDVAFDFTDRAASPPPDLGWRLGPAMILAVYSYLGYYNVCYVGEEVREPARTIPRAINLSVACVIVLYIALHLAMLGTLSWKAIPADTDSYNLPAEFMRQARGDWAAVAISILLMGCCFGSTFAGLLGYSRVPYGAAREGHFFRAFARLHARYHFPHRSLLLVGGITLIWAFFDLQIVINALITTRLLEMFCAQIIGLMLLRRNRPDAYRPWKMPLYPLPCLLALVGWLYLYVSSQWLYIALGLATLVSGTIAFLVWSRMESTWPFDSTGETRDVSP